MLSMEYEHFESVCRASNMKIQPLCCVFAIHIVVLYSVISVSGEEVNNETISTTTEKDSLISALDRIVAKVKAINTRIEKTLNETATIDQIVETPHDALIKKGYQFAPGIGYHKLYLTRLSWRDALLFCYKEKAHLAVIDSSEEALVSLNCTSITLKFINFIKDSQVYCERIKEC